MKKELVIGMIGVLIVAGLIVYYSNSYGSMNDATNNDQLMNVVTAENTNTGSEISTFTLDTASVALHNNAGDCWLIIDGGVYTVTDYMVQHPGGRNIIIPYCGKDATTAFATKAGQGSHSSFAVNQLAGLLIGRLGDMTTQTQIDQAQLNNVNTYEDD